jgi:hypothetical protein
LAVVKHKMIEIGANDQLVWRISGNQVILNERSGSCLSRDFGEAFVRPHYNGKLCCWRIVGPSRGPRLPPH